MNSDGDKLYTKLVAFDEIYNFVLQTFFIRSHREDQKTDILYRCRY
jgi:small nuclear ribonucleoprotein (snRNP)-like protein